MVASHSEELVLVVASHGVDCDICGGFIVCRLWC